MSLSDGTTCLVKITGATPGNKEYVDQLLAGVLDISTLLKKQTLNSKTKKLRLSIGGTEKRVGSKIAISSTRVVIGDGKT